MDHQITTSLSPPEIFKAANTHKLAALKRTHKHLRLVDTYQDQLDELFEIRYPTQVNNLQKKTNFFDNLFKTKHLHKTGNWVFYPWTNTLVHLLEENLFQEVRLARNYPIITKAQQQKFLNLVVGVAGLSVGNSIVQALAYSGGANQIKLADPDTLSLSNLNRIKASVTDLSLNKTYLAARHIWEINPYAKIHLYPDGINPNNIKSFFTAKPKLDLVFDEADDITLKYYLRLSARALKIPFLTITDNGFQSKTQILRFDKNPNAGGMKDAPKLTFKEILATFSHYEPLTINEKQKLTLVANLIGANKISKEMQKGTILRAKNKIAGWPQLAMTVFVGGSLAAYATKLIATGKRTYAREANLSIDTLLNPSRNTLTSRLAQDKHTKKFLRFLKSIS